MHCILKLQQSLRLAFAKTASFFHFHFFSNFRHVDRDEVSKDFGILLSKMVRLRDEIEKPECYSDASLEFFGCVREIGFTNDTFESALNKVERVFSDVRDRYPDDEVIARIYTPFDFAKRYFENMYEETQSFAERQITVEGYDVAHIVREFILPLKVREAMNAHKSMDQNGKPHPN